MLSYNIRKEPTLRQDYIGIESVPHLKLKNNPEKYGIPKGAEIIGEKIEKDSKNFYLMLLTDGTTDQGYEKNVAIANESKPFIVTV